MCVCCNPPNLTERPAWQRFLEVAEQTTRLMDRLQAHGWTHEEIIVVVNDLVAAVQLTALSALAGETACALTFLADAERALVATQRVPARRRGNEGRLN